MEQGTGVEPASAAWEAAVLPMYEPCVFSIISPDRQKCKPIFSHAFDQKFARFALHFPKNF